MKTIARNTVATFTFGLVTLTGITLSGTPAQAAFTSARGGEITRDEVMERAQYWLRNQPGPYSQSAFSPGPADSMLYRRDCSGYVTMAWHTSANHWYTGSLGQISSNISKANLKPGDILNYPEAHTVIFKSWANKDHTRINYYSFGSTPVKLRTGVPLYSGEIDGRGAGNYIAMRYDKIKDTAPVPPEEPVQPRLADVTGDGYTDLVAIGADGTMKLYSNNIERDNGDAYTDVREIGHGWSGFATVLGADVTGDGYRDVVAMKPDGTLWLYANNIERDNGTPYSAARQIGSGWNTFTKIIPADVTGDGFTDLIGMKADGSMWLYANNFVRDNGDAYSASRQIGSGWNTFAKVVPADVTGDGFTDLIGVRPDGSMWLYANNFVRDNGDAYSASRQIGSGWGGFAKVIPADVTGDGFTDLIGMKADGSMWLYANNFVRDNGDAYSASRQIGSGWNGFTNIF